MQSEIDSLREELSRAYAANRLLTKHLAQCRKTKQTLTNTARPHIEPVGYGTNLQHLQRQLDDADKTLKIALAEIQNSKESMYSATQMLNKQSDLIAYLIRELHNYVCLYHSINFARPFSFKDTRPYIHPFAPRK